MSTLTVHHTHTHKIHSPKEEGWEFWCPICSYRTRYILKDGCGSYLLEVIDEGDPHARHSNILAGHHGGADNLSGELGELGAADCPEEESVWLPVYLQAQIENIVANWDVGGWFS